jgi:hypothetical protein
MTDIKNNDGLEQQDRPEQSGQNSSERFANDVFSDPKAFLQTLKKDFDKIAKSESGLITENDLKIYADHGDDREGRKAAQIALGHFKELALMAEPEQFDREVRGNHIVDGHDTFAISKHDLQVETDMYEGNTGRYVAGAIIGGSFRTAVGAAATVASAGAAIVTSPSVAMGALFGTSAIVLAGLTGVEAVSTYNSLQNYHSLAARDRLILGGWSEINVGNR